jgi:hypothetical protein
VSAAALSLEETLYLVLQRLHAALSRLSPVLHLRDRRVLMRQLPPVRHNKGRPPSISSIVRIAVPILDQLVGRPIASGICLAAEGSKRDQLTFSSHISILRSADVLGDARLWASAGHSMSYSPSADRSPTPRFKEVHGSWATLP